MTVAGRYWSEPIARARSRRYGREADVPELLADVAMLRAIANKKRRQRRWLAILAALSIALGLAGAPLLRDAGAIAVVAGVSLAVIFVVMRAFVVPWDERRLELAEAIVRRIPNDRGSLQIDMRSTKRRAFLRGVQHGRAAYCNDWLDVVASPLRIRRSELLLHEESRLRPSLRSVAPRRTPSGPVTSVTPSSTNCEIVFISQPGRVSHDSQS